jgi:hypothetical protein
MVCKKTRVVKIPLNVQIYLFGVNPSLRCMNPLHRLESLHADIRKKLKGRRLKRSMLYLMLEGIVCRMVWDMTAFVIFADFIDDVYNVVADIYRLCKVQKTTLVRYLAGYIGLEAVSRHVTGAGFRISALAY